MCSLRHESDHQLAEPLARSLDRDGQQVTAFVPPGYERYVRILNPIEIAPGLVAMWSDVVKRGGLETSPWMQWDEVKVSAEAMPANNSQPDMGNPHPSLAKALIRVLDLDSSCYNFATWEGYAEEDGKSVIEFSPARRGMVLYSGKLVDEKRTAIVPITDSGRVPMYWWPDDLHWCIGQDIYARSLIIGCDGATAGKILADPELDAYLIRETDAVLPEDFEGTPPSCPLRDPLLTQWYVGFKDRHVVDVNPLLVEPQGVLARSFAAKSYFFIDMPGAWVEGVNLKSYQCIQRHVRGRRGKLLHHSRNNPQNYLSQLHRPADEW